MVRLPPRALRLTARGEQTIRALGSAQCERWHTGRSRHPPRPAAPTHPLPDSPRVTHRWPRTVRGRYPQLESNHGFVNGSQGRTDSRSASGQRSCPKGEDRHTPIRVNRTIDTRIFRSSESAVRRGKAEERERVFDAPIELPSPTEPTPNGGCDVRLEHDPGRHEQPVHVRDDGWRPRAHGRAGAVGARPGRRGSSDGPRRFTFAPSPTTSART